MGAAHDASAETGPFKDFQDDGGSNRDASDLCDEPYPIIGLDQLVEGEVFPDDDPADAWGVVVSEGAVGEQAVAVLDPRVDGFEFIFKIWTPGCAELLESGTSHGELIELSFTPQVAGYYTYEVILAFETGVSPLDPDPLASSAATGPRSCAPFCYSVVG